MVEKEKISDVVLFVLEQSRRNLKRIRTVLVD